MSTRSRREKRASTRTNAGNAQAFLDSLPEDREITVMDLITFLEFFPPTATVDHVNKFDSAMVKMDRSSMGVKNGHPVIIWE